MKYIIFLIFTFIAFNGITQSPKILKQLYSSQYQENKVEIKGIRIKTNEIPLNGAYKIQNENLEGNSEYEEKWIYANANKTLFAVVTNQVIEVNSDPKQFEEHRLFELYNIKGQLVWKTFQKESLPIYVSISNNGLKTHIIWYNLSEDSEGLQKLVSYDQNGKKLLTVDNVENLLTNNQNNIVYYKLNEKDKNNNLVSTIYCYNFDTNKKWQKTFDSSNNVFFYISENGNRILIRNGPLVCLLNDKGEILWEKEFDPAGGIFSLSYDGSLLLRIVKPNIFDVYDNSTSKLLLKIENDKSKESSSWFLNGCFVNNSTIAIVENTTPNKCSINLYKTDGSFIASKYIDCGSSSICVKEISNDTYAIYTDGIKKLEYKIFY